MQKTIFTLGKIATISFVVICLGLAGIFFTQKVDADSTSFFDRYGAGYLDGYSDYLGVVDGWAFDASNPEASTEVLIYVEEGGNTEFVERIMADKVRPDLISLGLPGEHKFQYHIPGIYFDGAARNFHFYAVQGDGSAIELGDSPYLHDGMSPGIAGSIDAVTVIDSASYTLVKGWGAERGLGSGNVQLLLYRNNFPSGNLLSVFKPEIERRDVEQYLETEGLHGFGVYVPFSEYSPHDGDELVLYGLNPVTQHMDKLSTFTVSR
jgi:hypothetical protein